MCNDHNLFLILIIIIIIIIIHVTFFLYNKLFKSSFPLSLQCQRVGGIDTALATPQTAKAWWVRDFETLQQFNIPINNTLDYSN
jgi:hypothetical protein